MKHDLKRLAAALERMRTVPNPEPSIMEALEIIARMLARVDSWADDVGDMTGTTLSPAIRQ